MLLARLVRARAAADSTATKSGHRTQDRGAPSAASANVWRCARSAGGDELAQDTHAETHTVVLRLRWMRFSFERRRPRFWGRVRKRAQGSGRGTRTGHGARRCRLDKAVSPGVHALHTGAVCVVCPLHGRGVVRGDDGGAVRGAVLVRRGGTRRGRGRAGRGRLDDGLDGAWRGRGALDELDDLDGVGLADKEVAGALLEVAVDGVDEVGRGGGEHDRGHFGVGGGDWAATFKQASCHARWLSKAPP